jgi:hypothetical protein
MRAVGDQVGHLSVKEAPLLLCYRGEFRLDEGFG